ncbi:MAG: hypothetical protein ACREJM_03645 [Candidatus Saccharimonadales bacterium]
MMVANQPARAEITDFGQIKKLVAPPGWLAAEQRQQGIGSSVLKLFHPPDADDVTLNVFYRGNPVAPEPAAYLSNLLKSCSGTAQKLTPESIQALAPVFGISTAGDNQYTNTAAKGSRNYPVFNLKSAEIARLKERPVVRLSGNFQDENGNVTMEYRGIFIQSDMNSGDIEEVFYQAPNSARFLKYSAAADQALLSIEWR